MGDQSFDNNSQKESHENNPEHRPNKLSENAGEEASSEKKHLLDESFLLNALLNNIPDSIYFKDKKSHFIKVSRYMQERFIDKTTESFIGKTDFDIQDDEHARQAFNDEQEIIKSGQALIGLLEKETLNQETRWVSTSKMPLLTNDGKVVGVFGISRDITDLIRLKEDLIVKNEALLTAEEELRQNLEELQSIQEKLIEQQQKLIEKNELIARQNVELAMHKENLEAKVAQRTKALRYAKEKAEESDRLKSAFLANLSHEIRTPMNSIVGFAQIIMQDDSVSDELKNYLRFINSNADSLLQLINDIVDLSMLESDQLAFRFEVFELNAFVHDVFHWIEELKPDSGVDFRLNNQLNADNLKLVADKYRLMQVVHNLLSNALKFTHKGSIEFRIYRNFDKLCFLIKDTGIGIAPTDLSLIFDRFRKSDSNSNKLYRGAGLGLTLSKKLATAMGGDIEVHSVLDLGSSFTLSLPLISPEDL
jgi:PAS domain S-box-containing protein